MKQTLHSQWELVRYTCIACSLFISNIALAQSNISPDPGSTKETSLPADSAQFRYESHRLHHNQFNKGFVPALEQAITAQFAGIRIAPHSGKLGSPYTLEAGHGNSFVGNNSPLLVVDGVILSYADVSPNTGFLSFLNPEDVESVTFLRDAAAMAAYGGKAVNGVLVINTKVGKPGGEPRLYFSSTGAVSSLRKKADVLSGDEIRNLVQTKYPSYAHLVGKHNTDWQDVIYQNGYGLDNSLSLSGAIKTMPYRLAAGHLSQRGILKTSERERKSFALNLNPSLFREHLTLDISLLHSSQEIQVANENVIYRALSFDPTQPIYAQNQHGGYFVYYRSDGEVDFTQPNPLSMLEQRNATDLVVTWLGQGHLRYKLHFLPSISLNYRRAYHSSNSDFQIETDPQAAFTGSHYQLETLENNSTRDFTEAFVDYNQDFTSWQGRLSLTGGALRTKRSVSSENLRYYPGNQYPPYMKGMRYSIENLEYYGNMTFTLREKYSGMLSMRRELSSPSRSTRDPFSAQSIGLNIGWDIQQETFINQLPWLSRLHATLSIGMFERLDNPNQFLLLYENQFGIWPDGVAEKTLAKRLDISYGLWQNKLQGSLAYYHNGSSDMLLPLRLPPGYGRSGYIGISAGELRSTGLETTLRYKAIEKGNFYLSLGLNASRMNSKVIRLENDRTFFFYNENHNKYLISEVGKPIHSFNLYKQLYGPDGRPMTGYQRQDNLPVRNITGTAKPNTLLGFQTDTGYGKWHASMLLRGAFGNSVYNLTDANGSWFNVGQYGNYLENASRTYENTGFTFPYTQTDYFLEPGSFVRLEYLQLQYDFGRIAGNKASLKLHATAQNAFVLTKYSGQDPEVRSGMDRTLSPQPRTFSIGLNLGI